MSNIIILNSEESKKIVGGKMGPYGECVYIKFENGPGGWYRDASNKNGIQKRCDEK